MPKFDYISDIFGSYRLITIKEYNAGDFSHYLLVRYRILQGANNQIIDGVYFAKITPNKRGDVNGFYNPPYSQVYLSNRNRNMLAHFVSLQTSEITAIGYFLSVIVYPLKKMYDGPRK